MWSLIYHDLRHHMFIVNLLNFPFEVKSADFSAIAEFSPDEVRGTGERCNRIPEVDSDNEKGKQDPWGELHRRRHHHRHRRRSLHHHRHSHHHQHHRRRRRCLHHHHHSHHHHRRRRRHHHHHRRRHHHHDEPCRPACPAGTDRLNLPDRRIIYRPQLIIRHGSDSGDTILLFCRPIHPSGLRFPSSTASAVRSWQSTQTSGCLLRALPIPPTKPSWGFTTCQAFSSGRSSTPNGVSARMVWPRAGMALFICWIVRWTSRRVCWSVTSTSLWRVSGRGPILASLPSPSAGRMSWSRFPPRWDLYYLCLSRHESVE